MKGMKEGTIGKERKVEGSEFRNVKEGRNIHFRVSKGKYEVPLKPQNFHCFEFFMKTSMD